MTDTLDPPITHPEEMRGEFDLHIGKNINLKGTGRMTPAGIVTVGITVAAILLSAAHWFAPRGARASSSF